VRPSEWDECNKASFLEGYAKGGGSLDEILLRAFELSNAVNEVGYEARDRPTWQPIPLKAFTSLP
jgi:maltokinase